MAQAFEPWQVQRLQEAEAFYAQVLGPPLPRPCGFSIWVWVQLARFSCFRLERAGLWQLELVLAQLRAGALAEAASSQAKPGLQQPCFGWSVARPPVPPASWPVASSRSSWEAALALPLAWLPLESSQAFSCCWLGELEAQVLARLELSVLLQLVAWQVRVSLALAWWPPSSRPTV